MRMAVVMLTGQRTPLAVDPAGVAVDEVLLLPDRHAVFHFVDDEAAGAKRFIAMRGTDAHPDSHIADGEGTETMHAGGARGSEPLHGIGNDARAFLLRQFDEGFVLQARDRL